MLVNYIRRADHQLLRPLRLRESNHLAERRRAGKQHRQPVHAERDTTMRRSAEAEGIQNEAEAALRLLFVDAEQTEHPLLYIPVVNSDRSAADFTSVQHEVVRTRAHRARIFLHPCEILRPGRRKRMMHRKVALIIIIPLEQRKISHPEKLPRAIGTLRNQIELARHVQA